MKPPVTFCFAAMEMRETPMVPDHKRVGLPSCTTEDLLPQMEAFRRLRITAKGRMDRESDGSTADRSDL